MQKTHNFTLPAWSKQNWTQQNETLTVYDRLMGLNSWEFDLKFGEPDQKARLRGGRVFEGKKAVAIRGIIYNFTWLRPRTQLNKMIASLGKVWGIPGAIVASQTPPQKI